jgi:nucleotide-binding universal stress UspA family protein
MTGSIICGVDDSEAAKGAARVARELSSDLRLRLVFVRVIDDGASDEKISAIAARLHRLAEGASDVDSGAHWLVEAGHPADRLVAAAEEQNAALIVVGSSGPRSSLLGSISADVSRRAPCPVVVVAPGADRSLTNGHSEHHAKTSFPGLFDDGYNGDARGIDRRGGAKSDARGAGPKAIDFAGGIVRFNLGGAER